jgi:NB-ARC domain
MPVYKIFLASSAELEADRVAFGDAIQEFNQTLRAEDKDVSFSLYKWERELESFTERRKQSVYNDNIENCDLFILLYFTKVGKYTEEEYDFSWSNFSQKKFPRIIVFKKLNPLSIEASVKDFEHKISGRDQQYTSTYSSALELKNKFIAEIRKLFSKGILPDRSFILYNDGQAVPAHFMGRDEELHIIKEKLKDGGSLMLINAEGGIGKTTLAAKYWQESFKNYRYKAWLFCANGIVSELKKLAPSLNLSLVNMTEEEQVEALKMALQNVSNDFLLVLDNANSPEDIRVFKKHFRGLHWHVLITSRCKGILEKEQEFEITTLPPPVAKDLFVSYYKEEGVEFEAILDRLLEGIHYHTLLVEIFARNMKKLSGKGDTLKDFLSHLETGGLFLGKRSFEIETEYDDNVKKTAATTDDILNILYDFSMLTGEERYWLVNMALLPATPHEHIFLCELFKQDKYEFRVLDGLAQKGWLGLEGSQYRISPVIQKITLVKNKATLQTDGKMLVDALNEKLENNGIYLKYFNEAEPYINLTDSIIKNLMDAPFYELSLLCFNSCVFYLSAGNLTSALHASLTDSKINEALGDKNGLAISLEKLGGVYEKMGELSEALKYYAERNRIGEELHRAYPSDVSFKNGLAISFIKLAGIYKQQNRLTEAKEKYAEAQKIWQQLEAAFPLYTEFKNNLQWVRDRLNELD